MLARILIILRSFDPNYFKAKKKNNLKVMNPVLTVACVLYIINFLYCKNESIKSISKENLGGERQETPNIFAMLTCDTDVYHVISVVCAQRAIPVQTFYMQGAPVDVILDYTCGSKRTIA